MPCYHPLAAWRSRVVNRESGKRGITFSLKDGFKDLQIQLPCGKCLGCREARGNEWAVRCLHESKMHMFNWFVTLTYSDENLPRDGSLKLKHVQDFLKRFRWKYGNVRYFLCGQYGEQSLRPHYHALMFGVDFPDLRVYGPVKSDGGTLYVSREFDRVWGFGECKIGELSPGSVRYVTNYMNRSVLDKEMCNRYGLESEFQVMSRRPGIGRPFIDRYLSDVYPDGFVTSKDGSKLRAPRYYDKVFQAKNPDSMWKVKVKRKFVAEKDVNGTGKRLIVREAVATSRRKFFNSNDPD